MLFLLYRCTAFLRLLGEYERNYKIALCGQAAVSLFWSFLLRSELSSQFLWPWVASVLDGRLAGSCVDQSGACQWQASQSTGEETPVMAGTSRASTVSSESSLGFCALWSALVYTGRGFLCSRPRAATLEFAFVVSLDVLASSLPHFQPFFIWLLRVSVEQASFGHRAFAVGSSLAKDQTRVSCLGTEAYTGAAGPRGKPHSSISELQNYTRGGIPPILCALVSLAQFYAYIYNFNIKG